VARLLILVKVAGPGGARVPVHRWLYEHLFAPWAGPADASLLFALAYVLLWVALTGVLYRRRIFIRV
jgi:predicted acyltransferase